MIIRDYQLDLSQKTSELLTRYKIAYLSMEVRTGKTVTAMLAVQKHHRVLFVTKKKAVGSILNDWVSLRDENGYKTEIATINYESLHLVNSAYDAFIIDEAHSIGAYPKPSERAKILRELCAEKPILYLSGTPTPESYSQLYHQFWISSFSPFESKNFYHWATTFVNVKKRFYYNRQVNDYSNANKHAIDQLTRHLFLSYTQHEAGFTCEVIEHVIPVRVADSTLWLAEKLKRDRVFISKDGNEIVADTEVKLLNKLHQIYSGTVIDESGTGIVFDTSKAARIAKDFHGKKIAIFYKFKSELSAITKFFPETTSSPEAFAAFDHLTFVSQIQSGREGINLSTADVIIMYNIDFSATSYWQARARMQVKGRKKPSNIYWLFSEGGIEKDVYQAVQAKKDFTLSYYARIKNTGKDRIEVKSAGVVSK